MQWLLRISLLVLIAPGVAFAASSALSLPKIQPIPPDQTALYSKAKAHFSPATLAKLQPLEAGILVRLERSPTADPAQIAKAGVSPAFAGLQAGDVDALTYIVLVDAANAMKSTLTTQTSPNANLLMDSYATLLQAMSNMQKTDSQLLEAIAQNLKP